MKKSKTILDFFSKSPSVPTKQGSSSNECSSTMKFVNDVPKRASIGEPDASPRRSHKKTLSKTSMSTGKNCLSSSVHLYKNGVKSNEGKIPVVTSQESLEIGEDKSEESIEEKNIESATHTQNSSTLYNDKENLNVDMSPIASSKRQKRKRIVVLSESEDSEDEYKPEKESESEDYDSENSNVSTSESPPKKKNNVQSQTPSSRPSLDLNKYSKDSPSLHFGNSTPKVLSTFRTSSSTSQPELQTINNSPNGFASKISQKSCSNSMQKNSIADEKVTYLHDKLDWLKPENMKDKSGKRKSHPDYDPETLYVPESYKKTLTPGLKQWWEIKSNNFDTVLFFKVGKFYEFYHMDAVVGVKELDLSYMKGDFAHAGFPEVAFGKFSDILIQKGYKVARIEQTETPQMMEQRCKSMSHPTKYDRVVKREICQVTSKGTRTLSYDEWSNNIGSSDNFLLSICEKHSDQDTSTEYGICFVDTTIGKFTLGQFTDDRHQSRLLSFIALFPPVEIVYEKSTVSQKTLKLFDSNLIGVSKHALNLFWDGQKTLKFMADSGYYNGEDGNLQWPETILQILEKDDFLCQTPLKEYELAFKALGACICYLKKCYIEDCLLTMKLFETYKPIDEAVVSNSAFQKDRKYMILDNVTLNNLAIVPNQPSAKSEETLFGTLNFCETNFGKRELRKWLCSPLYQPTEIYDRLDAINDLKNITIFEDVQKCLRKLPDLERLLNKIHVHGLSRNKDHPETRAIFYEMEVYNRKKILDLISALKGFKDAASISKLFEPFVKDFKSNLLKKCVSSSPDIGCFPLFEETLSYFSDAFDHNEAMKKGSIIPHPGVDSNYDSACKEINDTNEELESYRKQQCKNLNCSMIKYVNVGKNRFLLEVPENQKFPSYYEFIGAKKGFKRFYTKDIKDLLSVLSAAENTRDTALRDTTRKIFELFDKHYKKWQKAVQCLSTLDVLLSLTIYCKTNEESVCRPKFRSRVNNEKPYLEIIDGRHPTFSKLYTGKDYIPNSVYMGEKDNSRDGNEGGIVVLVTGPNMGGKSTLMRQTGTLLVMAHLGCYVPADSMELTPVDRIFTRVGANDKIFKGESTFFVESSETASILHHATRDSFALIDELGRGTATYDGAAIAYATAKHLAKNIGCRTLFSTHYHALVEDFHGVSNVGLGHMACMVEDDSGSPTLEKVTFLYKFVNGACPKSYGFNVARLAGIDEESVRRGFIKAQQMDCGARISKYIRNLMAVKSAEEIIKAL
nr:DNA mismatch repair protein Msh6-like [Parasteatoda tepidariorum]